MYRFGSLLITTFLSTSTIFAFNATTVEVEREPAITVVDFQNILLTELNNEIFAHETKNVSSSSETPRDLKSGNIDDFRYSAEENVPSAIQALWRRLNQHGWAMAESLVKKTRTEGVSRGYTVRHLQSREEQHPYPFVICNRSPLFHTGIQRFWPTVYAAGSEKLEAIPIVNQDNQTCFHISCTAAKARYVDSVVSNDELVIMPLIDILKIPAGTIDEISKPYWRVPSPFEFISAGITKQPLDNHWERIIHVTLSPGLSFATDDELIQKAKDIIKDIEAMAEMGSDRRRNLLTDVDSESESNMRISIGDAFSLLSKNSFGAFPEARMLESVPTPRSMEWGRFLENGIEADHRCNIMLASLIIRPGNREFSVFDIILNPLDEDQTCFKTWNDKSVEASASNVDCVASLIMALAIHSDVIGVEADVPITPDDFQAQWITQSKVQGDRPFFDVGLTGAGQIVSVTDSGLDISQSFFGPTSSKVYTSWSMTERKIVRYDSTNGDQFEPPGGHGTSVASVIAGKLAGSQENEADGIARDAKLIITDLQVQYRGYADPGPSVLFPSIYNNGKGAKITNGSWSSTYRPYSFRCRIYDQALYSTYPDILFVSSAGNFGKNQPNSSRNTIGDPASCKNIMAVGASQSSGQRIYVGDLGMNYLADFSSRGPTSDGRLKPDIIAPGYMVLTARAGSTQNSTATFETFGTSFSAPVIAGCAALVRQYFEEGWYPCGHKGCGNPILPTGSLVKAVLMNGAQSLTMIQNVPKGPTILSLQDYDSNQGMGLVNMLQSLPLSNQNQINAFVANGKTIIDGGSHTLTVQAKTCNSPLLSCTLVWYDPAGTNGCANCLLNDLDIVVENIDTSGKRIGNILYPNGLSSPDRKNNVERVRLRTTTGLRYRITVKAHNLSTQTQSYSLAVAGCFDVVSCFLIMFLYWTDIFQIMSITKFVE